MSNATSTRSNLTDAQLVLLSAAAQRKDGLVVLTDVHPSVSRTIAAPLSKQVLAELIVEHRQPHWREDENRKAVGLKVTQGGYAAIGVEHPNANEVDPPSFPATIDAVRPGTKQAVVIELLARPDGTSLADLIDATGWLPHTTRAVLSGLRKRGFEVASEKTEGGDRRYSIAASAQAAS